MADPTRSSWIPSNPQQIIVIPMELFIVNRKIPWQIPWQNPKIPWKIHGRSQNPMANPWKIPRHPETCPRFFTVYDQIAGAVTHSGGHRVSMDSAAGRLFGEIEGLGPTLECTSNIM